MSDTPRTEAEVNRQKCWSDDLVTIDANFACQLERELNAANESFRKLNIHALDLAARIKRLEEAGDAMAQELINQFGKSRLAYQWCKEKEDYK